MNDKIFSIEVELIKIFSALGVDKKENVESNFNFLLNSLLLDPVNESNLNKLSVDVKRNLAKRPGYSNAYYNFDNCLNILLKNESTQFLNSILVFFTNLETSNIDDESDSLTNSKMELNENTKSEKMFAGGPTQSTSGLGTMSILDTHTSNKTFPLITCNFSKCATKLEPTTISDFALMNECFYVLQGIQSCIIEFSENDKIHFINKDIKANYRQKQYVTKICSLGIIYIEIEHILNEILHHYPTQNSITKQVLVAAIRSELTIYFESLAILVSNVRKNKNKYNFTDLVVWFHKEMTIMNFLHLVCSVCKNKSGPVLMSILLSFNISADVKVAKTAKKFLSKLSQPWFNMITTWCLEGKLCDTYEFFIVKSPLKCFENLWTKAYFIKYQSLPKFISNHLAKKILLIGKSVNFIRVQCKVKSEISEYTKLKRFITQDSFSIYDDSYESKFVSMIDALYEETCSHLLHVMFTDFDLHLHFKIFHKFIVLQQGDFILEFMDLLSKELKTTKSLYLHNLTSILDVALRSITLSDSQINDRLDVKLLHSVENVSTWDAFCLTYHVDGPLETIFTNDVMLNYLRIFNFLWRLKRMKYMLTEIFQYQSTVRHSIFRKFNNLSKELTVLLNCISIVTYQMSTFIQHLQYYFNFEILECLWVVMLKNVENSKDLDDVISSQNTFVNSIIKMSGLDDKIFYSKINQICEEIIEYEKLLSNFSKEIEKYEKTQSKEFLNVLSDVYFKIIIFHKSFKTNTCSFLDVLSTRENLTNLKFRFEFNENYDFVD